jgi:hypothetical protein
MTWLRDQWETLSTAVKDKRHIIDSVIGGAIAVVHYLGVRFEIPVMKDISVWVVGPGIVLSLLFFWTLTYATEFRKRFDPTIEISDPKEDHEPWGATVTQKSIRRYSINVTNLSSERLANCSVTEFSFKNVHGRFAPETGRYFPKRSDRRADKTIHRFDQFFDLKGKGDSVGIDICAMNEISGSEGVFMTYATVPTSLQKDFISREMFPHWLVVRVTADNLPSPQNKEFKIFIDGNGYLRMETVV